MKRLLALVLMLCASITVRADALPTIEVFTDGMDKKQGFFTFYYDGENDGIYLQVDQLNSPFIFQTSLPRGVGSNDIGLDRGQLGSTRLVQFERFGNKILLKHLNTEFRAVTDNTAEQASINEAFADSVIAGFTAKAQTDNRILIEYTDYLLTDVHGISNRLERGKQGSFQADPKRSGIYLPRSKAFKFNTELEALITFAGRKPGNFVQQVTPSPDSLSVHLHHSFIALPDDGYQPRAFHPYSGFWKHRFFDYATPIADAMEQKYIVRHRLSKRDPSAEISEAVEPIVYYLDPGIPEPVMSALKEGALWWNQAFEAAGYKDAFQVKILPEDADPMDIRYNVIQWVHRATRGWSYGSSVVDPRTGELLKGHVTLGSLRVRQDYLIALGLTSPFEDEAASIQPQQEMALARIRQLSAHEVGHTLGIAHNFAASENGRASVMDYPHPKVSLKRGKIVLDDAYDDKIGEWDKYVVAYGYQDFTDANAESEGLAALVAQAQAKGFKYKSDPDTRSARHASSDGHLWDNGADPIQAFEEMAAVRKVALDNLGINTIETGANLSSIEAALVPIYLLHRYQIDALAKQVGGVNYQYEVKRDGVKPEGVSIVDPRTQKQAVKLLVDASGAEFLRLPDSLLGLIPPNAYGEDITREYFTSRTGRVFDPVSAAEAAAGYSLANLLHPERLNRLAWQHKQNRQVPSVSQVVKRILEQHWYNSSADYGLQSRLQLVALNAIMTAVISDKVAPEVKLSLQAELLAFEGWLKQNSKQPTHRVLLNHMARYWETGAWPGLFSVVPLPPGSPI